MKPYAESCDQNKHVILNIIQSVLSHYKTVLEIGSGTGQHAIFFAEKMPHLQWQTSDKKEHHSGMQLWIDEANLSNVLAPLDLDVSQSQWPKISVDAVFSANTAHIMHWDNVVDLFEGIGEILKAGGSFLLYGPFNYNQQYTSESNERFDGWLKSQDPKSGIRDFEALNILAKKSNMTLENDFEMPANNRILHWVKC